MHILAIILGFLGTAIFWAIRLGSNRKSIGDAANMVHGAAVKAKNMPRQRRFKKAHNRRGYDLVETPREAATVLMLSMAKSGDSRIISASERDTIEAQLVTDMQMSADDADGLVLQMESLIHDIVLPESALFPMTALLQETIDRDAAKDLGRMLEQVAATDGAPSLEQKEFLRRFRERWDLN